MLFELLPYPMHIVIKFLKPSKFYITSKNQRPVRSTSGKVGGARLRPFMVMYTIEVQKKITRPGLSRAAYSQNTPNFTIFYRAILLCQALEYGCRVF